MDDSLRHFPEAVRNDPRVRAAFEAKDVAALRAALSQAIQALPAKDRVRVQGRKVTIYHSKMLDADADLSEALREVPAEAWEGKWLHPSSFLSPEMTAAMNLPDPEARARAVAEAMHTLPERQRRLLAGGYQLLDELPFPADTRT